MKNMKKRGNVKMVESGSRKKIVLLKILIILLLIALIFLIIYGFIGMA